MKTVIPLSMQKQLFMESRRKPALFAAGIAYMMLPKPEAEKMMFNLYQHIQNKIVIVIAHRLRTVVNSHEIYLLHEGRLAERGSHESLLAGKNQYQSMFERTV